MNQLLTINPENVTSEELGKYKIRHAARAVVVDTDGKIAMLFVAKENYYKLPGGGLEGDEDPITALRRECQEEIGVEIDIIDEVGSIVEYRKFEHLNQISNCYLAKTIGQKGASYFTVNELDNNFRVEWLTYEEGLKAIQGHAALGIEGNQYIIPRDSKFLVEAKKYLNPKP